MNTNNNYKHLGLTSKIIGCAMEVPKYFAAKAAIQESNHSQRQ